MNENTHNNRILSAVAALLAVVLIGMTYSYVSTTPVSAEESIKKAESHLTADNYNLKAAVGEYQEALKADSQNKLALYGLARGHYILEDFDASFRAIAAYRDAYPEDARIDYIAGLANAYAGYLDASEASFNAFIASGLATWPAHLDLSWVHFKKGEFTDAQSQLEFAIDTYGANAWLLTALGAVEVALGENEAAQETLAQAKEHIAQISYEDWRANYTMNDPGEVEKEIAQMMEVADFNLALARGEGEEISQTEILALLSVPFADSSHEGINKGLIVSACGNSCTTAQCISAANICGQVNTGTQSSCGGGCSAGVPANPSGSCSVATECGVNATGFNGCSGGCNITRYPFCTTVQNPDGDGEIEWITIGDDGSGNSNLGATDVSVEIFAVPALVAQGTSTVVRWLSTETDSCEITTFQNIDNWTGVIGEEISSEIVEETTYTITCEGYDGTTVTDSATVDIVPEWEEF